jgi:hypothetical protein
MIVTFLAILERNRALDPLPLHRISLKEVIDLSNASNRCSIKEILSYVCKLI